jgi:hypothetical protein
MKTNKKYMLLSLVTVLTVAGMSLGTLGFAQTVTTLGCSVGALTVTGDQAVILTATGGNGTYFWSGQNLNVTNSAGNQFAVSYPNPGIYPITVQSAGQTATCNVNVVAGVSTGMLACSPAVQTVALGNTVAFTVTGGNGVYNWTSPDLSIANPTGSGFRANYATSGLKTLTVTSAGLTATCATNVLTNATAPVVPPVVTPSLPNTGGGFGE